MKELPFFAPLRFRLQLLVAQNPNPVLTPDEAVRLALEETYDIQLTRADADIARLNNTKGNAGMLPAVNFVAGDNIGVNGVNPSFTAVPSRLTGL